MNLLSQLTPYVLAVNIPYAVAVALVMAEVVWLARHGGSQARRVLTSAGTATAMAGGALLVGAFYTVVLRSLWSWVGAFGSDAAAGLWRTHPVVGALAAFVAWDLSGWLYHCVGHYTRVGWAAHQPHHSGEHFDLTLGLRQTWVPFHGLLHQPLLALAGFDFRVIAVCSAISNCWQILEHTSVRIRFPAVVAALVMTPDAHRHHHGVDAGPVNLGPVFTLWDRLAGTWVPGDAPAPVAYGLGGPARANPLHIELAGWRDLVRQTRASWSSSPRSSATRLRSAVPRTGSTG